MKTLSKTEVAALKATYTELVTTTYFPDEFPDGFELRPSDWALEDKVILDADKVEATIDGKLQKINPLLTMDLEFLSNSIINSAREGSVDLSESYPCGLKCPGCFSQDPAYADATKLLKWEEVMGIVDQGQKLGLQSAKFLGPGELMQNPDLFPILDAFAERDLPLSIFTKGTELGSDKYARLAQGHAGITSAKDFVERLLEYDGVRLLLGFNSFDEKRQNASVGSTNTKDMHDIVGGKFVNRGVPDYTAKRNVALQNLTNAGLNDPSLGQRLSLIAAPVGLHQIDEIPTMYEWAARRNMPLVIAPTMESGPKSIGLANRNAKLDPEHEQLFELYVAVYATALENGITSMDILRNQGVSGYMGSSPCNQVSNGLFMRLNGQVQMCPGISRTKYGNTHDAPLAEVWVNSSNYRISGRTNNWCTAKTGGMPKLLQTAVMGTLEAQYGK